MEPVPRTCPQCQAPGISYSRGVVEHRLSRAYPLIKCGPCDATFFFRYDTTTWTRCENANTNIGFTVDPAEIDTNVKLLVRTRQEL